MNFRRHMTLALPLAALMACEAAPNDNATDPQVREIGQSITAMDGAGFERDFVIDRATKDPATGAILYEAYVDDVYRTYTVTEADGATMIAVAGDEIDTHVELTVLADRAELTIAGQVIGHLLRDNDSKVRADQGADPYSFALLSLLIHRVDGLRPAQLFAPEGQGVTSAALMIGPLNIGKVSIKCKRVKFKINTCEQQCTQTTSGCSCGGQCGEIACCAAGCVNAEEKGWEYGGDSL